MRPILFLSYAMADSRVFQIHRVAKVITENEGWKVLYFERDSVDNFVSYMNYYIDQCNIFVLFCSENANKSRFVQIEWKAALSLNKKIIPIFLESEFIPPLLSSNVGIQFSGNFRKDIRDLISLIKSYLEGKLQTLERPKPPKIPSDLIKSLNLVDFRGNTIPSQEKYIIEELEEILEIRSREIIDEWDWKNQISWGASAFRMNLFDHIRDYIERSKSGIKSGFMGYYIDDLKIRQLIISELNLKFVPKQIFQLSGLYDLAIHKCKLKKVPDGLAGLKSLSFLSLNGNKIQNFPESCCHFEHLFTLSLNYNKLRSLPKSFYHLATLEILDLSLNKLREIPRSIRGLPNLEKLSLIDNKITFIPPFFKDMNSLDGLYLSKNKIEEVPASIGDLKNLKELSLIENKIIHLPVEILNLKTLKALYIDEVVMENNPQIIEELENRNVWIGNNHFERPICYEERQENSERLMEQLELKLKELKKKKKRK